MEHICGVKQHAVSGEFAQVAIYSFRGDSQIPGDLSVGHTSGRFGEELGIDVRTLLPVGRAESLTTEGSFTVSARKSLDSVWWLLAVEEADLFEGPDFVRCVVMYAVRVGALGWGPRSGGVF